VSRIRHEAWGGATRERNAGSTPAPRRGRLRSCLPGPAVSCAAVHARAFVWSDAGVGAAQVCAVGRGAARARLAARARVAARAALPLRPRCRACSPWRGSRDSSRFRGEPAWRLARFLVSFHLRRCAYSLAIGDVISALSEEVREFWTCGSRNAVGNDFRGRVRRGLGGTVWFCTSPRRRLVAGRRRRRGCRRLRLRWRRR